MPRAPRVAAVAVAALAAAAGTARADEFRVPGDFRSLEQAVEAAAPGDRIVVTGGKHRGPILVDVEGLTIEGEGSRLRGRRGDAALVVAAPGVTIRGLEFRGPGIDAEAPGMVVEGNEFDAVRAGSAVRIAGDGATVRANSVRRVRGARRPGPAVAAIEVRGADATVEGNTIASVLRADGILVEGDGAVVEMNGVDGVAAGSAIRVGGDGCAVIDNRCTGTGVAATVPVWSEEGRRARWVNAARALPGISVVNRSGGAVVSGNAVEHSGSDGFELLVNGADVSANSATWTGPPGGASRGIRVEGTGNRVASNETRGGSMEVRRTKRPTLPGSGWSARFEDVGGNAVVSNVVLDQVTGGQALAIRGDGNTVAANDVAGCDAAGLTVDGSFNDLRDNRVVGASDVHGDGYVVNGDGNVFTGNEASGFPRNGFTVGANRTENVFVGCSGTANSRCGFDNCGTATVVTGSRFEGNGMLDVLNIGWFMTYEGNVHGTGGPDARTDPRNNWSD